MSKHLLVRVLRFSDPDFTPAQMHRPTMPLAFPCPYPCPSVPIRGSIVFFRRESKVGSDGCGLCCTGASFLFSGLRCDSAASVPDGRGQDRGWVRMGTDKEEDPRTAHGEADLHSGGHKRRPASGTQARSFTKKWKQQKIGKSSRSG